MRHEFTSIIGWQKARALSLSIYKRTEKFPKSEKFNLTSQMRRSAISIPSNIAEGSGATSSPQFGRYLSMAVSSICELESQLYLSLDLQYLAEDELEELLAKTDEVKRLTLGLRNSVLKAPK